MTIHDPVFQIGVLAVHPFGLFVAAGLVVGYLVSLWRVLRAGLPARYLPGMLVVVVLGALMLARGGYLALHPDAAQDGLQGVLSLWRGGLNLAAGLIGGAVLLALYTWAHRESLWPWADALAPAVSLGLAVGMLGLAPSGEGWGRPTNGPVFMQVDPALRPAAVVNATRFQPIWAYESILFAALAVALLLTWRRRTSGHPFSGAVGLVFLLVAMVGYGALRPLTLDGDNSALVLQVQLGCAVVAAYACALLIARALRARTNAEITREIERVRLAAGK